MHNNYYFLRQLSARLNHELQGFSVVSCFSQNKDELIIELNNREKSFFIKALLLPSFCCLSFPSQYTRAKKNSVDLFDELILKKFESSTQYENERSFSLNFTHELLLLFKMHGNRANIILINNQQVQSIFKNQFKDDFSIEVQQLNKKIDWSEDWFWKHQHDLTDTYFTFGKPVWEYLSLKGFDELNGSKKWMLFQDVIGQLNTPQYYIHGEKKVKLLLFPLDETAVPISDPLEAINEFFLAFTSTQAYMREKQVLVKLLSQKIQSCESFIEKNLKKLKEIEYDGRYKAWADLLMANMHQIPKGADHIELLDFDGKEITIRLKPDVSVQKNAESFYRKAKNQEIEIAKLQEAIDAKKSELENSISKLAKIEAATNLKELQQITGSAKKATQSKTDRKLPYYEIEFKGFLIWIGKNASDNDELTQRFTHKDDLWLHAKDVAGSHVVIKQQSGKPYPKDVIERAAELAAYNSKRRNDSLCPVIYTPKKFVRKRKGSNPGSVIVDKEDVILVKPRI